MPLFKVASNSDWLEQSSLPADILNVADSLPGFQLGYPLGWGVNAFVLLTVS